jgi:predicted component of type VI protein secretion system
MASVTVIFGGQEQKVYELDKPRMVVGREPSCEIHIDNLGISRNHCAFVNKADAFVIQDLGSSNGTYVNGRKITEHFLNDADEVIIGKYTLRFKNETQAAAVSSKGVSAEAGVPDTLNTYVMDGAKIQEQLAKMRSGQQAAAGASAAVPAGATAKDYAKALDPGVPAPVAGAEDTGKMKTIVIALIAVVGVLLLVVVLFMLGVIKSAG